MHDAAATTSVPDSVRDVVVARLARLSPAARRMIEVAAVAGQRVDVDVLTHALDLAADELDAPLAELVSAGLLAATDTSALVYRFEHSLVRETVEAAVTPARRRRAHLAVAEAMEEAHAVRPPAGPRRAGPAPRRRGAARAGRQGRVLRPAGGGPGGPLGRP